MWERKMEVVGNVERTVSGELKGIMEWQEGNLSQGQSGIPEMEG